MSRSPNSVPRTLELLGLGLAGFSVTLDVLSRVVLERLELQLGDVRVGVGCQPDRGKVLAQRARLVPRVLQQIPGRASVRDYAALKRGRRTC